MIKSVSFASVLAALILFIQTTWFKHGIIAAATPDFALLLILWMSFSNKNIEGLLTAFVIGLASDFLSSSPLGFHIFLYIVPAYLAVLIRTSIFIDKILIPIAAAFIATILKAILSILLARIFGKDAIIAYSFGNIGFWIEGLMNMLLAPPLFWAFPKAGKVLITRSHTE